MPRRNKFSTLQIASFVNTGSSSPLPESAEACTQELKRLSERQRTVMSRLKQVSKSLNEMLRLPTERSAVSTRKSVADNWTAPVLDHATCSVFFSEIECDNIESPQVKKLPAVDQINDISASKINLDISNQSTPLVSALKNFQHRRGLQRGIKMWSHNLAHLFSSIDIDGNRCIDPCEYTKMISRLDLSEPLKKMLRNTFSNVDKDDSNSINLKEFLLFFLKFPLFKQELLTNENGNAPYNYEDTLNRRQRFRQWFYCIVECPGYNFVSKLLFCIDVVLTLVPIGIICCEGVAPRIKLKSFKQWTMWIVTVFFALEYICGLITCKWKKKFIFNIAHVFELISFSFWILLYYFPWKWTYDPIGFVAFRVIRFVDIHQVFEMERLHQDIDIYVNTLSLAYTGSGAVIMLLICSSIIFALLVYVFERGSYNHTEKRWERDAIEGESPFADISTCIYFTAVTMTTLGYGDITPRSFMGRLVAMIIVFFGLCNITFLINIVGDCFEDVFRMFILRRSNKIEEENNKHLMECVEHIVKGKESCWSLLNRKRTRCLRVIDDANKQAHK